MGGLGVETLATETFLVSVPVRPIMSGLERVLVSRDSIQKSRFRSQFHKTQSKSLGLGLNLMRPKLKVLVSVSIMRPGKLLVLPMAAKTTCKRLRKWLKHEMYLHLFCFNFSLNLHTNSDNFTTIVLVQNT